MIGIAFSGGKDSWACLHLAHHDLDNIIVLWVNTGKNYPETMASVEMAKAMCKNFIEIKADRNAQNNACGLPSDIVPFSHTAFGQGITGKTKVTLQSYFSCCYDNITAPLMAKVKELGIITLISGKRNDETHLSSSEDGQVIDGITHIHPIEHWSRDEVLDFLKTKMQVPEHFYFNHSSLDCYDCSAYVKDTKDIMNWSKKHPNLHVQKVVRMTQVKTALQESMEIYK
jgi:phosphoadenosine phosphosulfate reductase